MSERRNRRSCSGLYPHLAVFNEGAECGIGAVAPWAGRLWYLTYSPHKPNGSADKLYELNEDLAVGVRPESVGGTPASRMVHRESGQLILGPYFIDEAGSVRVVPPERMPGRLTGACRHLTDPSKRVYIYDMEGAFWEVNVRTLAATRLFGKPVPGWHGKGLYRGQGRVVLSNNGERNEPAAKGRVYEVADEAEHPDRIGCLAEWDGRDWRLVERRQHTEVTGPGGILGNETEEQPLWALGWDRRSALLKVLDNGIWHRYRLPKASYTYDGRHGWFTEWPRIREVADGFLLMDLHGMFYEFPATFAAGRTAGIRPLSSHHQMVVDFCEWRGRSVVACNHASRMENPLLGRAQSNLWFVDKGGFESFGPRAGWGGPWVNDDVPAQAVSEPFLFAGFDRRVLHLHHESEQEVEFTLELDSDGSGRWREHRAVRVDSGASVAYVFPAGIEAQWVRLRPLAPARAVTAYFHYGEEPAKRWALQAGRQDIFTSLARATGAQAVVGGIVRPMGADEGNGGNETRLQYVARFTGSDGALAEQQYAVDTDLRLRRHDDANALERFKNELQGAVDAPDFDMDAASAWVEEDGVRFRLPKGAPAYAMAFSEGWPRGKREIVTERDLWNVHGTFYEVPRESAGGVRHMRPVCTHNRRILDYCTWRGLLVLVGIRPDAVPDAHCVRSEDGAAGLWFGAVDDLWRLGKPVGTGGPWLDTAVQPGLPSDPYLMTGYDRKTLRLSHDANGPVTVTVEIDPTGYDDWVVHARHKVLPGATFEHVFPAGFSTHWIRFAADTACAATAQLVYA